MRCVFILPVSNCSFYLSNICLNFLITNCLQLRQVAEVDVSLENIKCLMHSKHLILPTFSTAGYAHLSL